MRRFAISAIVPLLALLFLALPANAGQIWCKADPIVRLNGTEVQIWVAIPEDYQGHVNGPIAVEVATHASVDREVTFTDAGFNGFGETVRFTDLKGTIKDTVFPVLVRVRVPIDRTGLGRKVTVPVRVEVIPDNASAITVTGTSDLTEVRLLVAGRY